MKKLLQKLLALLLRSGTPEPEAQESAIEVELDVRGESLQGLTGKAGLAPGPFFETGKTAVRERLSKQEDER